MSKRAGKINPRKIALLILIQYFKKGKSLKDIINSYFENHNLTELDRRFIFNLVKGTVRYYLKIDFILTLFSNIDIKDIDFTVLIIMRMGIYQLMYMDKVPDYSVVDESVKLARRNAGISSSGFVNAVLRKAGSITDLSMFVEEKIKKLPGDEAVKIGIDYSYPVWLVKYWTTRYGKEKTVLICGSLNENPLTYIRFNKNKISREELLKEPGIKTAGPVNRGPYNLNIKKAGKFILNGIEAEHNYHKHFLLKENISEDAIEVLSVQNIRETGAFKKGLITVQDLSSQLAVKYFLGPHKGEKILDVCAAPGGKTAYISELVGDEGEVVSVDISGKRLKILQDNLKRLNIKNVRIIEVDAAEPDFLEKSKDTRSDGTLKNEKVKDDHAGYFDKILIDAPCSAFGTISKNPDVKYGKTMDDIIRLSGISYKIMVNCDIYLKAGGKLIFYTCTLSHIENQQVIDSFLKEFKGRYIIEKPGIIDSFKSFLNLKKYNNNLNNYNNKGEENWLEIMPYYFGSEAGFACRLLKKS